MRVSFNQRALFLKVNDMPVIMQIVGFANLEPCKVAGMYVYDVQVQLIPNESWLRVTRYPDKAYVWEDAIAALAAWKEVLQSQPIRQDGRPNRPMTALSVILERTTREPSIGHPPLTNERPL